MFGLFCVCFLTLVFVYKIRYTQSGTEDSPLRNSARSAPIPAFPLVLGLSFRFLVFFLIPSDQPASSSALSLSSFLPSAGVLGGVCKCVAVLSSAMAPMTAAGSSRSRRVSQNFPANSYVVLVTKSMYRIYVGREVDVRVHSCRGATEGGFAGVAVDHIVLLADHHPGGRFPRLLDLETAVRIAERGVSFT